MENQTQIFGIRAIVEAINYWKDPKKLAEISEDLGESMR